MRKNSQHRPTISFAQLISQRKWTKRLINTFLQEPDFIKRHSKYKDTPIKLFYLDRVLEIEKSSEFYQAKYNSSWDKQKNGRVKNLSQSKMVDDAEMRKVLEQVCNTPIKAVRFSDLHLLGSTVACLYDFFSIEKQLVYLGRGAEETFNDLIADYLLYFYSNFCFKLSRSDTVKSPVLDEYYSYSHKKFLAKATVPRKNYYQLRAILDYRAILALCDIYPTLKASFQRVFEYRYHSTERSFAKEIVDKLPKQIAITTKAVNDEDRKAVRFFKQAENNKGFYHKLDFCSVDLYDNTIPIGYNNISIHQPKGKHYERCK